MEMRAEKELRKPIPINTSVCQTWLLEDVANVTDTRHVVTEINTES